MDKRIVSLIMLEQHLEYLSKFGSIRIQKYSEFLLKHSALGTIERAYIKQLPEYYNEDCIRKQKFIEIMTELNLWYTLYLTNY